MSEHERAAWHSNPWGMAAIDISGRVSAVNPVFEYSTKLSAAQLIGLSEADFDHLLSCLPLIDRSRINVTDGSIRAIHYVRCQECTERDHTLSRVAEVLREPLASIYGFAELLLTQHYDEQTRQDLTAMLLGQAEVMANLINERLENRTLWSRASENQLSEDPR
ncbi:MAG: hypothetical protein WC710_09190 [Gallionella sp.]|jgi:signal transduction histidine kinase